MKKTLPLEVLAPFMFVLVFCLTLIFSRLEPHVEDVDASYVKEHAGQYGYVLVDVRDEDVYEGYSSPAPDIPGGHIPGAISFPLEDLKVAAASAALAKAGITKMNTVILYCDTGVLAGIFADELVREFRFSPGNIKNYRGSVTDWLKIPGNKLLP